MKSFKLFILALFASLALNAQISGPTTICVGSTGTYTEVTTGGTWSSSSTVIASIGSSSGIAVGTAVGTATISYTVASVVTTYVITVMPLPAAITGPSTICVGSSATYSNTSSGGTWSSIFPATIGTTGIAFGLSAGTSIISYTLSTGCYSTKPVTVNPAPPAITGPSGLCNGLTITLSNATTGGVWTSSSPSIATVTTATGIVSGISPGVVSITYTISSGCNATHIVTVYPNPAAITGFSTVCVGSSTTLGNTTTGGIWTSSNIVAFAGSSTGVVSGTSAGTVTITYTLSTGCIATWPMTVAPTPAAITGPSSLCPGSTITLSNSTTGGTWSSSNVTLTTVGAGTGIVTGVAEGVGTITYTLATGCFVTHTVTVTPLPPIIGSAAVCMGSSVAMSCTGTGIWSTGGSSVASVGSTSGIVTGLTAGYFFLTYTQSSGCTSFLSGTVNTFPVPITGNSLICLGSTSALSNPTLGGIWSSTNASIASIGSAGVVTGNSVGSATISYTVGGTSCSAAKIVTVTASSATVYTVTGGGVYCTNPYTYMGVAIGLSNSQAGAYYELFNGSTSVGFATGTGSAISFGLFTVAGTYTVVAHPGTSCATTMSGTAVITVSAPPTIYNVTGGWGGYCSGGSGVAIGLTGSQTGVNYQLMRSSTPVGSPVAGTGAAISFGLQTTTGTYHVQATSPSTTCSNYMAGNAFVGVNPLPTAFTLTGGGSTCTSGPGVAICLTGSTIGINYQLFNGSAAVAMVAGTGGSICFGAFATAGTYTAIGTNTSTTCVNNMAGSATVTTTTGPAPITGTTSICVGGSTTLSSTTPGGTWSINNTAIATFGSTFPTITGISAGTTIISYTVASLGCTATTTLTVFATPSVFSVTGGGGYCAGGSGISIGLTNSQNTISYQLYNGATPLGSPISGTGSAISFGMQTAAGTYTVVANPGTSCTATMTGSATITINPLPPISTISGGGTYCSGPGFIIFCPASLPSYSYQLFNGGTPVGGPVAGTGGTIPFGPYIIAGNYTVVATNPITGCARTMAGSSIIVVSTTPIAYTVTGGGIHCSGGSGIPIGLSNSQSSVVYQLYNGATPVGSPVAGTGSAMSFGTFTTAGTYAVVANPGTSCMATMTGSAIITTSPSPTVFTVTGGGTFCSSGGATIGLSGSQTGISYQLYNGSTPVGTTVSGTGSAISFGTHATAGFYTVVAAPGTPCAATMSGSATITLNPLPTAFNVTGGSSCLGGPGAVVGLSGSQTGVNYRLYRGSIPLTIIPGTGSAISFGLQTLVGTYTVIATNVTTSCTATMTGSAIVTTAWAPSIFTVTGGGSYCAGGAGVAVGLSGTTGLVSYQLYLGGSPVGSPVTGFGAPISFGLQTATGIYTVIATSTVWGCTRSMSGSVTIATNPLPTVFTVTGGGSFCAGSAGVSIGLSGSSLGIQYRLYRGTVNVGMVTGTGAPISFGTFSSPGTYTVIAYNGGTTCSNNMVGSAVVSVNPLPNAYTISGGGTSCSGSGFNITLSSSDAGISYQVYLGSATVGSPLSGTGSSLSFGPYTSSGTYTVRATNPTTLCTRNMTGSAIISAGAVPFAYTVTGGGSYCAGGSGVAIGLSGSAAGISYRLYRGGTTLVSTVTGTGAPINFGLQTVAGSYTVTAINTFTTCTNNMAGSATITVNALPTVYSLTGSGTYCSGSGYTIVLSGSTTGITYRLYRGTTAVGSPMGGTGASINFGAYSTAGTYTVLATNPATSCTSNMTGSATITTGTLPALFTVTGGGGYCSGGAGVTVGLSGTTSLVTYQLLRGGSPVGSPITGAGAPISFGLQTIAGVYTILATSTVSGCTRIMSGSVTVVVNPLPTAYSVTGGGSICSGGTGAAIGLSSSNTGIQYRLYRGTAHLSTVTGTGSAISFGAHTTAGIYTVVAYNSGTTCTSNMTGSAIITVNATPTVSGSIYTLMPSASISLTASISGGAWTSGNTAVATVGSASGVVFGVSLGTANITYTLSTGCRGVRTIAVTPTGFRETPGTTPEQVAATVTDIQIVPNPSKGTFTVKGMLGDPAATGNDTEVSYEIIDMLGKVIYRNTATAHNGALDEIINLGNVSSGRYLLRLQARSESKVFHIVVEQ